MAACVYVLYLLASLVRCRYEFNVPSKPNVQRLPMASITVDKIHKRYDATDALKGISLSIRDGEFMTLVGPSGCGKSTLLRTIAGLELQTSGDILIDNNSVGNARPSDRNLAMVFQSYALYPHLSVYDNIAVPLRMRHHSRMQRLPLIGWLVPGTRSNEKKIRDQIIATAQSLGLSELLQRKPGQLSGGQRQRVAVGRAIVREPQAFLLDEPLSNLDAKMRVHMRTEITQLHRTLAATFVYVTHDQAEAMTMSDRIAVMMDGEIIQTGTPNEIYHRPADIRVAEFIGSPAINILPARVASGQQVAVLEKHTPLHTDGEVQSVGIRPEACRLLQENTTKPTALELTGVVSHLENFGAEVFVHVAVPGLTDSLVIRSESTVLNSTCIGDSVPLSLDLTNALAFDKQGRAVTCRLPNESVESDVTGSNGISHSKDPNKRDDVDRR